MKPRNLHESVIKALEKNTGVMQIQNSATQAKVSLVESEIRHFLANKFCKYMESLEVQNLWKDITKDLGEEDLEKSA